MAQFRQSGTERIGGGDVSADQVGIRIPQRYGGGRIRRAGQRSGGQRRVSVFVIAMIIGVALLVSASVLHLIFRDREVQGRLDYEEEENGSDLRPKLKRSLAFKELMFGKGSTIAGGDSRYWERDDRRRDEDYDEESSELSNFAEGTKPKGRTSSNYKENEEQERVSDQNKSRDYEDTFEDSLKTSMESEEEYDDRFEIEDEERDHGPPLRTSREQNIRHSSKNKASRSGKKIAGIKGTTKRHRFSGCEMKFLNSTDLLVEPVENKKFSRFSLQYSEVEERSINGVDGWEPRFAGHQTLLVRESSFYARDQNLNCGFIKGTGFDLEEDDAKYMASCHIAVSSCIFGNSDRLRAPNTRMIKRSSRKHVCFVMFVDEITLKTVSNEGQKPDAMGFYGLWKIVVVKNLPYTDMRRVGKIPKFLSHRLFPTARYSIWLDSKLRLNSDPQLLLEYFLWRKGYEYAISNHYDRHCLWDEVVQNKKLNKYNHTLIDRQFDFYRADGLKKFDPSDPKKLLPSNVPEGSFIIRAHTPMSNLFSCLWFNEVDRFTPRDQLSFAYTYLKLRRMNPDKPFYLNMFKDCERRAITKLYHHRSEDKRTPALDRSVDE